MSWCAGDDGAVSQPEPTEDDQPQGEPTQPLRRTGDPSSSWLPPTGPPAGDPTASPASGGWPSFPPPGAPPVPMTQPMPVDGPRHAGGRQPGGRTRMSGWVWPAVTATALVLGIVGGVAGSIGYEEWQGRDAGPGTVPGGFGAVDTSEVAPLAAEDGSVAAVAQALLPSTVQISASLDGQDGGATGSGFVLDEQGHVVTNNHVIADAAEDDGPIQIVDQEGNRFDATVVGRSPVYDLAVLYSEDVEEQLEPAALGRSQRLRVGEGVVAIGSPLGLSSTVTSGIVSALDRPVTTGSSNDDSSYINAVQTDAAINPGNSGGPLVNLRGQVVGVNSAIATTGGGLGGESGNIGVGFAIPMEQVIITSDQILRNGEARFPVIGAQVRTGGDPTGEGAEIDEVNPDTPAESAGLEKGDVVTSVDGDRVVDGKSLIVAIRTHQPGETIEFTFLRDGTEQTTEITLGGEVG